MDIQTSPDPVARARELGAEIAAAADEIERTRRIPEALLGRLHDSRLFRMLLPRSAGGDETEPAVYVAAIEELARHDASIAWNVFVANSSALIAAYLEPAVNHAVFADPRSIVAWGPPNASRASAVDGRLSPDRQVGFRQRLPASPLDGRALPCARSGRRAAAQPLRPAHGPHAPVSGQRRDPARHLADDRAARHGVGLLLRQRCVRVRGVQHHTREDPTLRRERGPLYAFTMQCLYATGVAAVGFGIARAMLSEFIALASRKAPRNLARLADNAVVQADVARAEARLGSARAYLIETLTTIYAHADDVAPIEVADRARVRLACTNAIQGAAEVADFAYKASGRRRDLPGQPVRAPLPRHAHALSADPGTRRPFRVGRADPARRAARGVFFRVAKVRRAPICTSR